MQYKLIACDMDGTLLDPNREISPGNLAAIRKVLDLGVIFTISTGRPVQAAQRYQEVLQLKTPIITYNGGMIVTPDGDEVLYERNLDPKAAAEVIRLGHKLGAPQNIWSENRLYSLHADIWSIGYAGFAKEELHVIKESEIDQIAAQGIAKILWYDELPKVEAYQETLRQTDLEHVHFFTSSPDFLEIVDSRVSKATALQFLGEYHGISPAEMIAIGDGMNDISMLEYAGLAIAMENAPDAVKAVADWITRSNTEDGVAYALEKYVLT